WRRTVPSLRTPTSLPQLRPESRTRLFRQPGVYAIYLLIRKRTIFCPIGKSQGQALLSRCYRVPFVDIENRYRLQQIATSLSDRFDYHFRREIAIQNQGEIAPDGRKARRRLDRLQGGEASLEQPVESQLEDRAGPGEVALQRLCRMQFAEIA